jgi:diguanylate cyclase (GGDEF)-like protein
MIQNVPEPADEADELLFVDELDGLTSADRKMWKVLIADDDQDVHAVTKLVFREFSLRDCGIEFLDAYSGDEACKVLEDNPDIAVVFLDVVMESDDAGLKAAKRIREELGNSLVRIILRTGQPGHAPEERVILDYDINDYKSKSELTSHKLFTSMVTALRSFQHLQTIEASRHGLEQILEGSVALMKVRSTERFLSGLLIQIQAMFNLGSNAVLCVRNIQGGTASARPTPIVLAGAGNYEGIISAELSAADLPEWKQDILNAFESGHGGFKEGHFSIYFYSREVFEIVILFETKRAPSTFDNTLIEVFCTTAAVSLSNIHLLETLEEKVVERTNALSKANEDLLVMATTDALTRVRNRGYLFEVGDKHLCAALRYKQPLTSIILDVDHFKAINDTHGHAVGDQVLKCIADVCSSALRQPDIFARYGGEEFVALLPETDLGGAMILAERLRISVETMVLDGFPEPANVTISVGVASVTSADTEIAQTIRRADQALYQAKHQGRNRVVAINQE